MYCYKKHPEFNLLEKFLFDLYYKIDGHLVFTKQFVQEVYSKRDDPEEYFKALIKFVYS